MLAVSGYRACGKSEAASQLSQLGVIAYDSGPSLRAATATYNRQTASKVSPEEYVEIQSDRTGNADWPIAFDVKNVLSAIHEYGPHRSAIIGYRNYSELKIFEKMVSYETGFTVPVHLIVVRSKFTTALRNFQLRERLPKEVAKRELEAQHCREREWGMPEIEANADIIIENEGFGIEGKIALRAAMELALGRLGYDSVLTQPPIQPNHQNYSEGILYVSPTN